MGVGKLDLLKDPFYAQLMHVIENVICLADKDAQEKGIRLTDSNIKSALNKARRVTPEMVRARTEFPETREAILQEMSLSIAANRELLREESADGTGQVAISHADWGKAIGAVEASLQVRRSDEPGSRCYLDFVRNFIEKGTL